MPWAIRTLLTISAIALPLSIYIGFRSASAVGYLFPDAKRRARWIAILLLAWLYSYPVAVLTLHLLGSTATLPGPDDARGMTDYLFLYPQWISLVIVAELTAPFLLLDFAGLAGRFFPARRPQLRRVLAYIRLALVTAAVLYVPVRIFVDTTRVEDSTAAVHIKGLPAGLEGFRITLVGDIQVDKYTGDSRISRVHSIVRTRDPHLLLSSGDIVTGGTAYLNQAQEAMCGIKGSLASVAVMGDHDQWSAPDEIRDMHKQCGWVFLENEHRILHWRGKRILVTGLTHIYSRRLNDTRLTGILERAPEADIRILLVHQPAEWIIHRASEYGYTIVTAGHTHGGQIVLHPLGIPLTPSMHETQYYSGSYRVGSTAVVVTDGVGLTLAPIRYHARSEVTTIVLQPGETSTTTR